jgi:superfamily II DNA or RNA helicase
LRDCQDVRLDGVAVTIDESQSVEHVVVRRRNTGYELKLEPLPAIDEVFPANGMARKGDRLFIIEESKLTPREHQQLVNGLQVDGADVAALITDFLPKLRERIAVDASGADLPTGERMPARIDVQVDGARQGLSVLATIVYGDPAVARVDGERLVHLGHGNIPQRDHAQEKQLTERMRASLGVSPGEQRQVLANESLAFFERLQKLVSTDPRVGTGAKVAGALTPRIAIDGDRLDLSFEYEGKRIDGGEVLAAWEGGAVIVPLGSGLFAPLPHGFLAQHGQRLVDLLAAKKRGADAVSRLDLVRVAVSLDHPLPPELEKLRALVENFTHIPAAALPADLRASLRSYQRHGVDWLCLMREAGLGALLADDMGLGKTLQSLSAIRGRTLVVAPTSVLFNWVEELQKFRPGLGVSVYHGPRRVLDDKADVVVTTYALLRLDSDVLSREQFATVIIDEAHTIKNPDSQVARAAYALRADFRVALTGTPVENRLDELWSLFHFLNPGLLGSRDDFQDRYGRPIEEGRADAASALRDRIRPLMLRRLKADVAPELPPRTEMVERCELTRDERAVYDTVRAAVVSTVVEQLEESNNVLAALEALLRLRQAACHAGLVPGQAAASSSKIALLLEMLEEALAEGHKALVFSQWTSLLDLVEPHLQGANMRHLRLDGATRDRQGVVTAFQDPAGPNVLLISLKAGGTGLNLTEADHVFLLDPWWNPAVEDQAADRAHRIGQTRPVMVHRLIAQDTVEEGILNLQQKKRAIAAAALGEGSQAASITREDLLALLRPET